MELTPRQQQDIGLDFVLDRLLPLSPLGQEKKRALSPYARTERAALEQELENLGKAAALGERPALGRFRQGLMQLRDIRGTVAHLGRRCGAAGNRHGNQSARRDGGRSLFRSSRSNGRRGRTPVGA